ncbi:hypothetical protein CO608_00360 [Lysobacteraceae bacterium NML08-0793]|nr:hypothetical protein CO608_00360 [Xanthomonadaceae bacterium NML08-0793]
MSTVVQIQAKGSRSRLEIGKNEAVDGYSSFWMLADIQCDWMQMYSKLRDVHFVALEKFVEQLDAFVLNRQLQPHLEGTEGTWLAFQEEGRRVLLRFALGAIKDCMPHQHQGSFELEEADLSELAVAFSRLFEDR